MTYKHLARSFVIVACCSWFAPSASAWDCLPSELEVLWSYPVDGQQEVPTDASFWLLSDQGDATPRASALLNGQELKRLESDPRNTGLGLSAFAPPSLAPNTHYTLRVSYERSRGQASKSYELHFTTGAQPHARVGKAKIGEWQSRAGVFVEDHPCKKIIMKPGCLVIPEPDVRLHTLQVTQANVLGWHLKADGSDPARFWPAVCGSPTLTLHALEGRRCFELEAIDLRGSISAPRRHCVHEKASTTRFDRDSAPDYAGPLQALAEVVGTSVSATDAAAAPLDTHGSTGEISSPVADGCGGCSATRGAPASLALHAGLLLLGAYARRRL